MHLLCAGKRHYRKLISNLGSRCCVLPPVSTGAVVVVVVGDVVVIADWVTKVTFDAICYL